MYTFMQNRLSIHICIYTHTEHIYNCIRYKHKRYKNIYYMVWPLVLGLSKYSVHPTHHTLSHAFQTKIYEWIPILTQLIWKTAARFYYDTRFRIWYNHLYTTTTTTKYLTKVVQVYYTCVTYYNIYEREMHEWMNWISLKCYNIFFSFI